MRHIRRVPAGDLAGGDAPYIAKVVRAVAAGEPSPALDAVLANAAGALATRNSATSAGDFEDGRLRRRPVRAGALREAGM
jgi:anthranilate phosphoribosyltransferase